MTSLNQSHPIRSPKHVNPQPPRWVHYYLAQETLGPTVGVPYDYVVPDSALVHWRVNGALQQAEVAANGTAWDVTVTEVRAGSRLVWRVVSGGCCGLH